MGTQEGEVHGRTVHGLVEQGEVLGNNENLGRTVQEVRLVEKREVSWEGVTLGREGQSIG